MEPTLTNSINSTNFPTPMTKLDFSKTYWFNSLQMVTVVNPTADDYPFMVEMRHFVVKAGATEKLPGAIVNIYLDQMSKILAQGDNKLGFMADPNLMRVYFDKLIVDVENLVPEYNPTPAWMQGVAPSAIGQAAETPPWQQAVQPIQPQFAQPNQVSNQPDQTALIQQLMAKIETLEANQNSSQAPFQTQPVIQPSVADTVLKTEPTKTESPEQTKEFTYLDSTYKMTVNKNGDEMFFKNGRLTTAAEYAKSASML
jgi:hypothetical protein